jgi:hypothetical protein
MLIVMLLQNSNVVSPGDYNAACIVALLPVLDSARHICKQQRSANRTCLLAIVLRGLLRYVCCCCCP